MLKWNRFFIIAFEPLNNFSVNKKSDLPIYLDQNNITKR